jgi:hypothetical protein
MINLTEENEMSEMSGGSAANSTSRPDAAGGDVPVESDLPGMQGLDSGVVSGTDDDVEAPATADLADDTGSVSGSTTEGTASGSSDPMPDIAGTS